MTALSPRRFKALLLIIPAFVTLGLAWVANVPAATAPTGESQLEAFATHLNLVQFSLGGTIGSNGAMGANLSTGTWQALGEQHPFEHLLHSLVFQDSNEAASVVSALEYTFAHQTADGSWADVPTCSTDCDFIGTFFFYADFGRALGLMRDSSWFQTSPSTASLRTRLAALVPKVTLGLTWLSTSPTHTPMVGVGRNASNRGAAAAEALILVGQWAQDASAVNVGEQVLQTVTQDQASNGVWIEENGFDAGYQMVTFNHLADVFNYVQGAASLAMLRPILWSELVKGQAVEQSIVLPSGEINFNTSSRVYCGGETYAGSAKQGGGQDLSRAWVWMAAEANNTLLINQAQQVINYYANNTHSHCVYDDTLSSGATHTYAVTSHIGTVAGVAHSSSLVTPLELQVVDGSGHVLGQTQGLAPAALGLPISVSVPAGQTYNLVIHNLGGGTVNTTFTVSPL